MKRIVFILCASLLLAACVSQRPENNEEADFRKKKKAIAAALHGGWVSKQYLNNVVQRNSIYKAATGNLTNVELIIDTTRASEDTIVNPGSYINDHESDYFQIVFEKDSTLRPKAHLIYTLSSSWHDDYYLEVNYSGKDTTLVLVALDSVDEEVISRTEFVKVYTHPPKNDYHISPTEALFASNFFNGKYKLLDNKNNFISNVTIDYHDIYGFPGCSSYLIYRNKNFTECYNCTFDYIVLLDEGERKYFHWVKKNDGLELYELENNNGNSGIGDLRFRLARL